MFTDINSLKLWRYTDPLLGPRKIPVLGDLETKCLLVDPLDSFKVDVDIGKVELVSNGNNIQLGTQMVYTYEK